MKPLLIVIIKQLLILITASAYLQSTTINYEERIKVFLHYMNLMSLCSVASLCHLTLYGPNSFFRRFSEHNLR